MKCTGAKQGVTRNKGRPSSVVSVFIIYLVVSMLDWNARVAEDGLELWILLPLPLPLLVCTTTPDSPLPFLSTVIAHFSPWKQGEKNISNQIYLKITACPWLVPICLVGIFFVVVVQISVFGRWLLLGGSAETLERPLSHRGRKESGTKKLAWIRKGQPGARGAGSVDSVHCCTLGNQPPDVFHRIFAL